MKLAVELARRFNGEIINGDAMQLYHGLPVITNKITQEEMKGIPHHLLGCIGLEQEAWTVGKFVSEALITIKDIRSRGKLPILVGGTHYYTQSLIFHDALAKDDALNVVEDSTSFPILKEPTNTILNRLKEVDPIMADRWHPNERRKIQRSLELYLRTGKPASQLYNEQRMKRKSSPSAKESEQMEPRAPRFSALIFWVHVSRDVLQPRLDNRVDKMLERGLLSEVQELSSFRISQEDRTGTSIDQSRGIWVSIGYKEFLDYQFALSDPSRPALEIEKLKTAAIEKTQAATRQYANRQVKWIRIKLLNALLDTGQECNLFLLDASDLSRWGDQIIQPAIDITEKFLSGQPLPVPSTLSAVASEMLTPKREYDLGQRPDLWQKKVCDTCGTVAVTENDWSLHMKSRNHRKATSKKTKNQHTQDIPNEVSRALQTEIVDVLENYMVRFAEKQ